MRLQQIHVFPVKSMAGQSVPAWPITPRGLTGDRGWALVDGDGRLGSGKDSRRFRRFDPLFSWRARLSDPAGTPQVSGATGGPTDGGWFAADDPRAQARLQTVCWESVRLSRESDVSHFDAAAVSLVGTATLEALGAELGLAAPVDPRHLRANLVIETDEPYVEDGWVDHRLGIGAAQFEVLQRVTRCRMVDIAQADLPALPGLLKATGARQACAAVYLRPLAAAQLQVGAPVLA